MVLGFSKTTFFEQDQMLKVKLSFTPTILPGSKKKSHTVVYKNHIFWD